MYAAARLLDEAPASTLTALACVALALWPEPMLDFLAYQRHAVLAGEIWRLWTAHLVHFSPSHALADAIVLLAMGALAEPVVGVRRMLLALAIGAPLISLGLLWGASAMLEYRGASGMAVMAAVVAGAVMWREGGAWKVAIAVAGSTFLVKMVAEAAGGAVRIDILPAGVSVAWQAHLLGALCGFVFLGISWAARFTSAGIHRPLVVTPGMGAGAWQDENL